MVIIFMPVYIPSIPTISGWGPNPRFTYVLRFKVPALSVRFGFKGEHSDFPNIFNKPPGTMLGK